MRSQAHSHLEQLPAAAQIRDRVLCHACEDLGASLLWQYAHPSRSAPMHALLLWPGAPAGGGRSWAESPIAAVSCVAGGREAAGWRRRMAPIVGQRRLSQAAAQARPRPGLLAAAPASCARSALCGGRGRRSRGAPLARVRRQHHPRHGLRQDVPHFRSLDHGHWRLGHPPGHPRGGAVESGSTWQRALRAGLQHS